MKKVLHLMSSPKGDSSVSRKLGKVVIEKILQRYPDSVLTEKDLNKDVPPHLTELHIQGFFTPPENRSTELNEAVKYSDEAIQELFDNNIIVIETPMYNFTVTSTLKAYLDQIVRYGVTFANTENGIEGLLKHKKVYLALSSGWVYTEGERLSYDFIAPYLEKVLGYLGITDISVFRAEGVGLGDPEIVNQALKKGIDGIMID